MAVSVNVLGLGMMGRPMAHNLLEAGVEVRGWNRSSLSPDLIEGIPLCQTLQEASRASVCLMMLSDSAAVDAVLEELEPYLEAGQVVTTGLLTSIFALNPGDEVEAEYAQLGTVSAKVL